jgi:hypothetical protein
MPTTKLVRIANWIFGLFALVACLAVPEPQAYTLAGLLILQAVVSHWTLPGPAFLPDDHE